MKQIKKQKTEYIYKKNNKSFSSDINYGWFLKGRSVTVLNDYSYKLFFNRQDTKLNELSYYFLDKNDFTCCIQCGICTAICGLADKHIDSSFPRKQIMLFNLGEINKLISDPSIWLCFNCSDCSLSCPANVKSGKVMAALRQMSIEEYSFPGLISRFLSNFYGYIALLFISSLLIAATILVGGSFLPDMNLVRYSSMLPYSSINFFFFILLSLILISQIISIKKVWRIFSRESILKSYLQIFFKSLFLSIREIFLHRDFSECREFPFGRFAHLSIFYGFTMLFIIAGIIAMLILLGIKYPLDALHPLKIIGNIAALFLLFTGCGYFIIQRLLKRTTTEKNSWYDWELLITLSLVTVTGIMTEVLRYLNIPAFAYPVYFIHLSSVLMFFIGAPYSKMAHLIYRTLAMTALTYNEFLNKKLSRKGLKYV